MWNLIRAVFLLQIVGVPMTVRRYLQKSLSGNPIHSCFAPHYRTFPFPVSECYAARIWILTNWFLSLCPDCRRSRPIYDGCDIRIMVASSPPNCIRPFSIILFQFFGSFEALNCEDRLSHAAAGDPIPKSNNRPKCLDDRTNFILFQGCSHIPTFFSPTALTGSISPITPDIRLSAGGIGSIKLSFFALLWLHSNNSRTLLAR